MVIPMRCGIASVLLPVSHGGKPKYYKKGWLPPDTRVYVVKTPESGIRLASELSAVELLPFSALL
jgi:hypothetical protein